MKAPQPLILTPHPHSQAEGGSVGFGGMTRDPRIDPKRGDVLSIDGLRMRVRRASGGMVSTTWLIDTPRQMASGVFIASGGDNMTANFWPAFVAKAKVEKLAPTRRSTPPAAPGRRT